MAHPILQPSSSFTDPRLLPEFDSALWPLCNDVAAPDIDTQNLHERRCIEFLAAYYALNRANAALLAIKTSPCDPASEASGLSVVNAALEALEAIEDYYAPIGFWGEPQMDGVYYHNIVFQRPELPRFDPTSPALSSLVAIPGLEELGIDLRGPITVTRWRNGKMDLQERVEPR